MNMSPVLRKKPALWEAVIDVLLPPRCAATGDVVDVQGMISPAFWPQLQFIESPFCRTCGTPFSFEGADNCLCAVCMEREPLFDQARSAVVYNDASRKLILGFKYGDRLHTIHTFVPWMLRAGRELIEGADLVVPVPLHTRRLRERRFNQSALLAQEIVRQAGGTYAPDILRRVRHTIPQKGLNAKDRGENVRGAFAASGDPEGKNILLIDDVFTSGATLNECARVMKAAGAATVSVLTIARVTKEEFA